MTLCKPEGPLNARIMIVGECPDERAAYEGRPFCGNSGFELTRMLQEAGITRTSCFLTYLVNERPPKSEVESYMALKKKDITEAHSALHDKLVLPPVIEGYQKLISDIEAVKPNIIIALGNTALWALTQKWGIMKWRGSCLEYHSTSGFVCKVIATYSPTQVFRNWASRGIVVRDLRRARAESTSPTYERPDYRFIVRPTYEQVMGVLDSLFERLQSGAGPMPLSVDIETRAGHIACIGLAWSALDAICIPLMAVESPKGYWTEDQEFEIWWKLYNLLRDGRVEVIGQNFLYDAQYFYRWGCFIPNLVWDTMTGQHVCFATMKKGLDFLSSMYCSYHVYWKDEGKEWNTGIGDASGEDVWWSYNCKDAVATFEIAEVERKTVKSMGLEKPAEFQQGMFGPILRTMNRGVRIDAEAQKRLHKEYSARMDSFQAELDYLLGFSVNCRSPKQIADLFYKALGQRPILNRKTGSVSTDDESLTKLAAREPLIRPLVENILAFRSTGTRLSTFIDVTVDSDGRLRCYYNPSGTETYRLASGENAFGTGTNFQNFPPDLRVLFVPDEGQEFFDIDGDSADLRIVVAESGEQEMQKWLDAGLKPYVEIAKEFYKDPTITKQHPKYKVFKAFAHGTHYLGTPAGMAPALGLLVHDVDRLQKWYFSRFPRIKSWQDDFCAKVTSRRYVENIFGYRCYIFDRIDQKKLNEAIAWLPQSTVAIFINKIWKNLDTNHSNLVEVLLQVHDSLAGQFPIEKREEALAAIHSSSQIILPYRTPTTIPIGIKTSTKSWGDCE